MKIFRSDKGIWEDKVNFVDEYNVFVGYDMRQSCCEDAGWFIKDAITPYSYDTCEDSTGETCVEGYIFDKGFFQDVASGDLDEGGMVAFKLIAEDKPDLYLHIYNSHNGYYGHGFEVKHGGETVQKGCL